jgi:integrase
LTEQLLSEFCSSAIGRHWLEARDYALLRLLWGNALRRNEISQLNVRDFDPASKTLQILGKGRGTQSEVVDLGVATVQGESPIGWKKGEVARRIARFL